LAATQRILHKIRRSSMRFTTLKDEVGHHARHETLQQSPRGQADGGTRGAAANPSRQSAMRRGLGARRPEFTAGPRRVQRGKMCHRRHTFRRLPMRSRLRSVLTSHGRRRSAAQTRRRSRRRTWPCFFARSPNWASTRARGAGLEATDSAAVGAQFAAGGLDQMAKDLELAARLE
jgi:hypothetical protein